MSSKSFRRLAFSLFSQTSWQNSRCLKVATRTVPIAKTKRVIIPLKGCVDRLGQYGVPCQADPLGNSGIPFCFASTSRCPGFWGRIRIAPTRPDADYISFHSSHSYENGRQRLYMFLLSTIFSFRKRGNSYTRFSKRYFCSLLSFTRKEFFLSSKIFYIYSHLLFNS